MVTKNDSKPHCTRMTFDESPIVVVGDTVQSMCPFESGSALKLYPLHGCVVVDVVDISVIVGVCVIAVGILVGV